MSKKVIIEKAGIDNIAAIINLAERVWPFTYRHILSPEQVDYMMELFYSKNSLAEQFSRHHFIIAWLDGEPAGFASYGSLQDQTNYKLHKLYVLRDVQGSGLGRALVNFIVDEIKTSGGKALELNVNRNNMAKVFYERLGFKVIREEDIDIGNGFWMNDYVMRLEL